MFRFSSIISHRYRICIFKATMLLLFIPVWLLFIAPHFKKIPDNFSYQANILSIDNFYDEVSKKYQGEHISKTAFSYRVKSVNDKYNVIENKFSVRTLNDKLIISITRFYFIDPYTWQHTDVSGEQSRHGYLFGPQWAGKNSYNYWHINYNTPALMEFVAREEIDGLTVNHYEAVYTADQTTNLGYLPGVPEKRGIKAKIKLQLWIEPVSGWLVKYQDNTLAEYYDIKTGREISPWNMFSNRYTQNSVRHQVHIASLLKWKIITIYLGVPLLLILMAIIFLWVGIYQKKPMSIPASAFRMVGNVFLILIFSSLLSLSIYYFLGKRNDISMYKVGISEWNNTTAHVDAVQGFKDGLAYYGYNEGDNIEFIVKNPDSNIEKQVDIIQSFQKSKVNLIFTLSTAGTLVAKGMTNRTPVVFSEVSYPKESNVISSYQGSTSNLVGVRNYISPAVLFNLLENVYPDVKIIGFVHHKGDPDSEIQYQEFKSLLAHRNIQVIDLPATDVADLSAKLQNQYPVYQVLFLACDTLIQQGGGRLVAKYGLQYKIPTFTCDKDSIRHGALIGMTINPYLGGVFAGKQAALILRGAEPSWLHTEQPERGYLMINLSTARLLGINISDEVIKKADFIVKENSQ